MAVLWLIGAGLMVWTASPWVQQALWALVVGCVAGWALTAQPVPEAAPAPATAPEAPLQQDALTGLPNRQAMSERLSAGLAKGQACALLLLDLDHFGAVNDSFGPAAGDALLIEASRRMQGVLQAGQPGRADTALGRLGSDEFMALLPGCGDDQEAWRLAQRLQAEIAQPFTWDGMEVDVSASLGLAVAPQHGTSLAELMRAAELALRESKRVGYGQTTVYAPSLEAHSRRRLQLANDLRGALERREFVLHYQPLLFLPTGRIEGAEALLRWEHPQLGRISPGEFIPLLEATGQIREVGQWVFVSACAQMQRWIAAGSTFRRMSINVSVKQLTEEHIDQQLVESVRALGLPASAVCVEVTESLLLHDPQQAQTTMARLREGGLKVSLDDFGTGYSSLSYLRDLPLDSLKIDRSFVLQADTPAGLAICEVCTLLAGRLGFEVTAEGVETAEQLQRMAGVGAHWIQGFGVARPMPAPEALAFAQTFDGAAFATAMGLVELANGYKTLREPDNS